VTSSMAAATGREEGVGRRSVAAFTAFAFFAWGVLGVTLGSVLPEISDWLHLSPTQGGLVFVVWAAGFMLGSGLVRGVLASVGFGGTLAALSFAASLFAFGIGVAPQFLSLLGGYLLVGACGGAVLTAGHTLFSALFPECRSSALGVLDVFFSLGNLAAPLTASLLLGHGADVRFMYALIGTLLAANGVLFVLGHRLLSETKLQAMAAQNGNAAEGTAEAGAAETQAVSPSDQTVPLRRVLLRRTGATLALAGLMLGALEWSQNVWFVTYAIEAKELAAEAARLSVAFFTVGMIVARLVVVSLGVRSTAPALNLVLALLALLGAVGIMLPSTVILLSIGNFALGFGMGALFPILLGVAMDRDALDSSSYSAILVITTTAGAQGASVLIGASASALGFSAAYLAVPIFAAALLAGVFVFLLPQRAPTK
jgi:fucose permease